MDWEASYNGLLALRGNLCHAEEGAWLPAEDLGRVWPSAIGFVLKGPEGTSLVVQWLRLSLPMCVCVCVFVCVLWGRGGGGGSSTLSQGACIMAKKPKHKMEAIL